MSFLGTLLISLAVLTCSCCVLPKPFVPSWQSVVSDTSKTTQLFAHNGSNWYLRSDDGVYKGIAANVPGDLLTDLINAGIIDDPYFDRNFLTQRRIWMGPLRNSSSASSFQLEQRTRTWIYSTEFSLRDSIYGAVLLIVEGIKMGASLSLNGVALEPSITDQFLRYEIILPKDVLAKGRRYSGGRIHTLEVRFDPSINTNGRFMACSGGWDWAPYSQAGDQRGSRVFTLGIVQNMYVVEVEAFYITSVVPKVYYDGPYPQEPLLHGSKEDFVVLVEASVKFVSEPSEDIFLCARYVFSEETGCFPLINIMNESTKVFIFRARASKDDIDLWWPNGMGDQVLYSVSVSIEDSKGAQLSAVRKHIGFRTVALVTLNDTDKAVMDEFVQDRDGSGRHGMYFRVNGALVYSRGANVVPMDQLEGRWSDEGHRVMVQSAAAAQMNMLRIWGGGAILPDAFYDACDEFGILLYHDLMFVGEQKHDAVRTETIKSEIACIVRKLSEHPSIALWSGCNECTYNGGNMTIYESFVMQTVAEVDDTRVIWPSSPSNYGWDSGVRSADGRPNGKPLRIRGGGSQQLESHGPYQRGFSATHPGVNGMLSAGGNTYETHVPPKFHGRQDIGPNRKNTFISEFGASVSSSFESMSALFHAEDWSLHGGGPPDSCQQLVGQVNVCNGTNPLAERNYPCDARIHAFYGRTQSLDDVGPLEFQRQLHQCMIAQALWMKGQIEIMRSSNSFGTLIWQLNENWPTGGWGLLEYGPERNLKQQVIGGRWKPLMYLLRNSLFRDVFAACGKGMLCYVRNDGLHQADIVVDAQVWSLSVEMAIRSSSWSFNLPGGRGSTEFFDLPPDFIDDADVVLLTITDVQTRRTLMNSSAYLWNVPLSMPSLRESSANISWRVSEANKEKVSLVLQTDRLALYVVLSSKASGCFSDNAFHLRPGVPKTVWFYPVTAEDINVDLMLESLRVEHLGSYMPNVTSTSAVEAS